MPAAAGEEAHSPESDATVCRQIVRIHARTFTLASRFLPEDKRRASHALYAFCRIADDLVDGAPAGGAAAAARELDRYGAQLERTLAGYPEGPIFRELAWSIERFSLPTAPLRELLAGVRRDLEPARYESWEQLGRYCEGVASSVGEMCAHVFGVTGGDERYACAIQHARTLGIAMQLTNILRDVGEDARRGRCYLPEAELETVGSSSREVIAAATSGSAAEFTRSPAWRALMRFQIARARALYEAAWPGHFLLRADARRCAVACSRGYSAILSAIEQIDYDTIASRARVGSVSRVAILWEAWRVGARREDGISGDAPSIAWAHAPDGMTLDPIAAAEVSA